MSIERFASRLMPRTTSEQSPLKQPGSWVEVPQGYGCIISEKDSYSGAFCAEMSICIAVVLHMIDEAGCCSHLLVHLDHKICIDNLLFDLDKSGYEVTHYETVQNIAAANTSQMVADYQRTTIDYIAECFDGKVKKTTNHQSTSPVIFMNQKGQVAINIPQKEAVAVYAHLDKDEYHRQTILISNYINLLRSTEMIRDPESEIILFQPGQTIPKVVIYKADGTKGSMYLMRYLVEKYKNYALNGDLAEAIASIIRTRCQICSDNERKILKEMFDQLQYIYPDILPGFVGFTDENFATFVANFSYNSDKMQQIVTMLVTDESFAPYILKQLHKHMDVDIDDTESQIAYLLAIDTAVSMFQIIYAQPLPIPVEWEEEGAILKVCGFLNELDREQDRALYYPVGAFSYPDLMEPDKLEGFFQGALTPWCDRINQERRQSISPHASAEVEDRFPSQ